MRRALAALIVAAALAGCRAAPPDPVEAPGPQPGVDVAAVQAWLRLDPATLRLGARAALTVRHPDTLTVLRLGLDDAMEVRAVRVGGQPVTATRDGDALLVPLQPGRTTSSVEVVYRGVPAAGVYAGTWAGRHVVYADGWPDRTAGWLPTVHHPSDPAAVDLTLVVPDSLGVVASGALVQDSTGGGWRTARFRLASATPSGADGAPPYTVAFAVGRFEFVDGGTTAGGVAVRHALLDGLFAGRLHRTGAALDTLAALLGPYPYTTYATVQVPLQYAGMENAGAPFLRADLYAEDLPGRTLIEEVNWHEMAHQWWGDAVVPADWRDLWLAEGPATYLTTELSARLDGEDAGRRFRVLMAREIEREDAARALVPPTYADPSDVLTPTVYNKGGAVMHLLRLTVGEAAFWGALRRVQTEYAARPLSTDAFRRVLEAESGRSLDAVFQRWVYSAGLPTLRVRWDRPTRTLSWAIEGDGGTLDGVPFELYVRQGETAVFVPFLDGVASLPADDRPTVEGVGILLDVRVR